MYAEVGVASSINYLKKIKKNVHWSLVADFFWELVPHGSRRNTTGGRKDGGGCLL